MTTLCIVRLQLFKTGAGLIRKAWALGKLYKKEKIEYDLKDNGT
jgi:hypothetical protein